ncbi:MAG: DUF222 domain-containing protein [Acidimicrobiales bacterium]|nr:DUF222 domain-containing protein [Acidimicrobiales bacterium]
MDLDVLTEAIDRLHGSDPSACADTESIEILQRQLARLDAFVTKATAVFDASGNWQPDCAANAAAWLVTRCRLPKAQARRAVRRARSLRHLPECTRAWAEGDITAAQFDVVDQLRDGSTEDALARDEEMLVAQAATLRYDLFARAASYWRQLADPDGAEDEDERRRAQRDVYLESSFRGMWLGRITLDPISGSIVAGELERLERALFESDWAAARARLGGDPTLADLDRNAGQRRADALVEMATRSQIAPSDGRRPTPLFSVLIDYEALRGRVCELAQGTAIAPGSLLPWLDEAHLERVVFAPERRVEVSATARLFSGATRRAVELRDRECTHRFCDVPAKSCQVDHIVPFAAGGPTIEENGRLLCGFHNRLRNGRPPPDD